jgi:TPP-dependent pyruvate/acetoin dehydrogenase alpha subunit
MTVADMLRGYLGTLDSPSRGRDGHVGSFAHRVIQPISNIGNMPPVAAGIGLVFKMRASGAVALTWIGDGSVKAGAVHEALNFAAVQRLPVIFIIQNNQVALGTRAEINHLGDYGDIHEGYGVPGWTFDGNHVLDAYAATRLAADLCRAGDGPVILTANTFRMGGHATHDEKEARHVLSAEQFAHWGRRDPIGMYETYLAAHAVDPAELEQVEAEVTAEVDREAELALSSRDTAEPPGDSALDGVYAS